MVNMLNEITYKVENCARGLITIPNVNFRTLITINEDENVAYRF